MLILVLLSVVFDGSNTKIYVLSIERTAISSTGNSTVLLSKTPLQSDELQVVSFQYNPWPRATTTWVDRLIGSRSVHFNPDVLHQQHISRADVNVSMSYRSWFSLLHHSHQLPAYARWSSCSIELLAIRRMEDHNNDNDKGADATAAQSYDTSRVHLATLNINSTWNTQCYLRYHPFASQQSQPRPQQPAPQRSQPHVLTSSSRPQTHQQSHQNKNNLNRDMPLSSPKTRGRRLSRQQPQLPHTPTQQSLNLQPSNLHPVLPSSKKYHQNQRSRGHQSISVFCPAWEQQNCDDYMTLTQSNATATGTSQPLVSDTSLVFGTFTLLGGKEDSNIDSDKEERVKKDLDHSTATATVNTPHTVQTTTATTFHAHATLPTHSHIPIHAQAHTTTPTPTTTMHILSHNEHLSQRRAICLVLPHQRSRTHNTHNHKHLRKHAQTSYSKPSPATKPSPISKPSPTPKPSSSDYEYNTISDSLWDLWVSYHTVGLGFHVLIYDSQRRSNRGVRFQDNPYVKYHPYTAETFLHHNPQNERNEPEEGEENEEETGDEEEDVVLTLTRCRFEAKVWVVDQSFPLFIS